MLFFFKSSDCIDLFPSNIPSRFFVKIPELIQFNTNQLINIVDLNIPKFVQNEEVNSIYVTTNIVSEAFVGYKKIPVLQRYFVNLDLNGQNGFQLDTQFVQSSVKDIITDVIEIGILNGETLDYVQCEDGVTYCGFKIK
jgi:hypothetical protein